MLDPDAVLNSVLASLQSIPELSTELGAPAIPATASITGHFFEWGEENALVRALAQMRSPSILIAYLDYLGGNFDGMTVWKHRLNMYIRPRNKASNGNAASAQHLWWLAMNYPVSVPIIGSNIRYVNLLPNLDIMDIPTLKHQNDELGQDFFVSTMVIPEIGDAGPDGINFLCLGPADKQEAMEEGVTNGLAHTK